MSLRINDAKQGVSWKGPVTSVGSVDSHKMVSALSLGAGTLSNNCTVFVHAVGVMGVGEREGIYHDDCIRVMSGLLLLSGGS